MATLMHNTPSGVNDTGLPSATHACHADGRTAPARRRRPVPQVAHPAFGYDGLYGVTVVGGCMSPLIEDGEVIACDPSQPYAAGDIVVIYYKNATGEIGAQVKRLVLGVPSWVKFPHQEHPDSTVAALVMFECLVPPRQFRARAASLLNIHKVVGKRRLDGTVDPALVELNARHWQARIEHRRAHSVRVVGAVS